MDFLWYYPKSITGTAICGETSGEEEFDEFLSELNRFVKPDFHNSLGI